MDILTAKGLVKYYGKGESLVKAVDHTSFSVEKGGVYRDRRDERFREDNAFKSDRRPGQTG